MKIIQSILTNNPCFKAGKKIEVKGLMLHSVGCPQPNASVFVNNWNKSSYNRACVHGFIDAKTGDVHQTLPWNHRGWHAGGQANNTHIGVEMCEPDCIKYTGGSSFTCSNPTKAKEMVQRTYNSAVELFAFLCKQYNLDPMKKGVIIGHKEGCSMGWASNHGDPDHLWKQLGLPYTMDTFRQAVRDCMTGDSKEDVTAPSTPSTPSTGFPVTPFLVKVIIPDLNYRSEPSMSGKVKGQTGKGTFTIVQVSNGWGKLKSGAGWIWLKNPSYCTILKSVK
jgi:N-acetylmuramoyl-L-alanine amidase CwlA